jgi:NAD(P)-dependent dehydrogenase (short-subunit alcohol dehydrogenase family)
MKKITIFGGTGGLGSQVVNLLQESYSVTCLGSKDVDVTKFDAVKSYFDTNEADIVINLSGYNYDTFLHKYQKDTYFQIEKQIDINVKGSVNIAACAIPQMRDKQYGRLILVSSILADHPVLSTSIYAGCKGFVDSLVKVVALENASKNISCNSLQLGYFDGGLTYKIPETLRDSIKNNIPSKRWGTIQELFNIIDYLINTPYITGQNINISGGII